MGYEGRARRLHGARLGQVRTVLWVVLWLNLAVALAKLVYGIISGSVAMTADGFHSMFDSMSNVVGLVGIAVACRPADRDHPYGHGKYETYASAAIGAMLLVAAWNVGSNAWLRLTDGGATARVTEASFVIMLGTLATNILVTAYERRVGARLKSEILLADASHTLSDVGVSLGVIGGLVAVRLGFPKADPAIALLVAAAIVWTAWQVLKRVGETLSDTARISATDICGVVLGVSGVLGCHMVRTRGAPAEVYVDLHVQVDPSATLDAAHDVAERVERTISEAFVQVADVIVHVEPLDEYQARKTAERINAGLM